MTSTPRTGNSAHGAKRPRARRFARVKLITETGRGGKGERRDQRDEKRSGVPATRNPLGVASYTIWFGKLARSAEVRTFLYLAI
jgi:hypothetical protein